MRIANKILLLCVVVLTSACGNLQAVKLAEVPTPLRGSEIRLSAERPSKDVIAPRAYEVPNHSVFFQQTTGGSAAVGLLLGPLGVAANMANIDRITDDMGRTGNATGLYSVDALQEVQAAWKLTADSDVSPKLGGVTVKPYIGYFVMDEKLGIYTVVGLRVEGKVNNADGAPVNWGGQYNYIARNNHKLDTLDKSFSEAELANFHKEIQEGFNEIRTELIRDLSTQKSPKRKIAWVKSPVVGLFGLGAPGDIEQSTNGRLTLRVNMNNYGIMIDKSITSYVVYILPPESQYTIENGPVEREEKVAQQ